VLISNKTNRMNVWLASIITAVPYQLLSLATDIHSAL